MPKIIKSRDSNKYLCTNVHSSPGGSGILLVKNPICLQCGTHLGSIPGLRRSPGGGHGNPLWDSCLENPHGQKSLVGYSPWESQRVGHDLATKNSMLLLLLLLLSHFSSVWLCATPQTAAHQAPPSLRLSRQEHWGGLPFPSPMHESEK